METAEFHLQNAAKELQQGHARTAHDEVRAALRIQPDSAYALSLLGLALTLMGEELDAREALIRAIETAPRDRQVRYFSYLALGKLGDARGARTELTYFTQLDPANSAAKQMLARMGGPVTDIPPLPAAPRAAVWYDGGGHATMDSDQISQIQDDGEPQDGDDVIVCPNCEKHTWKGWVCHYCGDTLPRP
jgi:predicted Zn-dependent protease